MMLPNAQLAKVEREKLVDYLLNPAHPHGASKARFFADFGFQADDWETLANALRAHCQHHEIAKVKETGFGPRYEVDRELDAADGRRPRVRTVWQVDHGEIAPRLLTAYPLPHHDQRARLRGPDRQPAGGKTRSG